MKKIMFNDACGLTAAAVAGAKTMTRRKVRCPRKVRGTETFGYNVHSDPAGGWREAVAADGEGADIEGGEIRPAWADGETVAVAQGYGAVCAERGGGPGAQCPCEPYGLCPLAALRGTPGWNNKMFVGAGLMPHRVRITGVRLERLRDISDGDCLREGVRESGGRFAFDGCGGTFGTAREAFAEMARRTMGRDVWERNPYVFAYGFEAEGAE